MKKKASTRFHASTRQTTLKTLFVLAVIQPQSAKSEDIHQVWASDAVADQAIHEIGREWSVHETMQFNSLSGGRAEWTNQCLFDAPRIVPVSGGGIENYSIINIGNRAIAPRDVRYRSYQGQKQAETLGYSHAFQSYEEVLALFPNKTGQLQIRVRGSADRCENPFGPSIKPQGQMRKSISFILRCNGTEKVWNSRMPAWIFNSQDFFPEGEDLAFDQTVYIPFDTSVCDSEMFLTAKVPAAQRFTITSLETVLWSD